MFARIVLAVSAVLACGVATTGQEPSSRIWQGVYTAAQADRGKAVFDTACLRCHGADLAGNTAPALTGDRFQATWGGGPVGSLFGKIRDTMPPNFGALLDDREKLDIVTYILKANGFPAGPEELRLGGDDLASAQILGEGELAGVQDFSLVATVGCLASGPDGGWMLTQTAEPRNAREDAPDPSALAASVARPLGSRTYRLLSVAPFEPAAHVGHKVEARGLVYTEPGDERITLTSLQRAGGTCGG